MPSTEPTLAIPSSKALGPKSAPRRFPSAVQTIHFKAFWVKPSDALGAKLEGVQTVIPKRLLKKAVDRNGLRRVLREAVRASFKSAKPRLENTLPKLPTPRVVLTSAKGFAEQPSRHALKGVWREELDRLMALLLLRLKA
jgi:RNase P protein component